MEKNRLNTDHVQPQNPLFTSGSQHPPRSRHAVHLGEDGSPHRKVYSMPLPSVAAVLYQICVVTPLVNKKLMYQSVTGIT